MGPSPPLPHTRKSLAVVFIGCTVFFLILFAQFPIAGRISGNIDSWYAIAFPNVYLNELRELLGFGPFGSFLYPTENPLAYGETAAALAVVPMVLRAIGLGDVMTLYLFVSWVYAFTAFSVYLVATLYVRHRALAMMAGLAFSASNFLLAIIDSPHNAFFGIAFLSLYFFKRFLLTNRNRDFWFSAVLAGVQTYFSAYGFLLLFVALAVIGLTNIRQLLEAHGGLRRLFAYTAVVAGLIAPFFCFYLFRLTDHFSFRSQALVFAEFNSLDPQALANPMPDNLIYPEGHRFTHQDAMSLNQRLAPRDPSFFTKDFLLMAGPGAHPDEESLWVSSRKRAFVGLSLYLLALTCFFQSFRGRREWVVLGVVGFIVSLGPTARFGDVMVPMPLYPLYEYVPGFHMFRVPGRAFCLSLLALTILAAKGLGAWVDRQWARSPRAPLWAAVIATSLFVVENVPFPMRSFEGKTLATPPEDYARFFSGIDETVILNLPSGIGFALAGSANDLNVFNREIVYTNWQTYHGHSIVNGVNGYIPHSRIATQRLIEALPNPEAVDGLARLGVRHIVYNKNLVLPEERQQLQQLQNATALESVFESDSTAVFRIRR